MKENLKSILLGVAMLIAAAFFYFVMEDFTFYVSFIPLNNVTVSIVTAVIGVLSLLMGILDKGSKANK